MARETFQIGTWRFDPESGELLGEDRRVGLEDRAARTLELLCRRRGEVVTHAQIVAEVWAGRRQSPNSVAVVISGLRRTLGDDARDPAHIETVTKRGYRLREAQDFQDRPSWWRRHPWAVSGLAFVAVAAAAGVAWIGTPPERPVARVEAVVNDTGDPAYRPLARAVEGVVLADLHDQGRVTILGPDSKAPRRRAQLVLKTRLLMWAGHPSVELTVIDPSTGVTTWSGMAPGPEADLPDQVAHELAGFGASLAARGADLKFASFRARLRADFRSKEESGAGR